MRTPIIALTAHAMVGDDQKCLEAGCDGYIAKPIRLEQLYEVIAKYLESVRAEPSVAGELSQTGSNVSCSPKAS